MNNLEITMSVPYFQVPNEIFEIGLDKHELLTYMYLARCGNQGSKAFPSYNKIAEKTGISRRKVIDTIKSLEEKNLLVKEKRYNSEHKENYSNIYRVEHNIKSIGSAGHAPSGELYALCGEHHAPYKEPLYKEPLYKEPEDKELKHLHSLDQLKNDYVNFYLRTMSIFRPKHKRVTEENLYYIEKTIENLDIDIEEWKEAVIEHFRNLPKNNDGDILAFLKASDRYFRI